jgi:hypothetical protein
MTCILIKFRLINLKELEILKEDYAKMIVKSYKSRSSESRAMFLLSSENFLQAYKEQVHEAVYRL